MFQKRVQNSFFSIKNSFKFFLTVKIYDMKTDKKKLKEFFLREKELKMRKKNFFSYSYRKYKFDWFWDTVLIKVECQENSHCFLYLETLHTSRVVVAGEIYEGGEEYPIAYFSSPSQSQQVDSAAAIVKW